MGQRQAVQRCDRIVAVDGEFQRVLLQESELAKRGAIAVETTEEANTEITRIRIEHTASTISGAEFFVVGCESTSAAVSGFRVD